MATQDQGIHSFQECAPEGSDYLEQTLGRVHTRWSSAHNKRKRRWGQLKIKLSRFKEDPSSNEEYEELNSWRTSYHLSIWIRNDDVMNEYDDEVKGSRRSLPMKRIKGILNVGKIVYNRIQEKKDETCSEEQVKTVREIVWWYFQRNKWVSDIVQLCDTICNIPDVDIQLFSTLGLA